MHCSSATDTGAVFDTRVIEYHLTDNSRAIARLSSLHDWKPNLPAPLFHGGDDRAAPYAGSKTMSDARSHPRRRIVWLNTAVARRSQLATNLHESAAIGVPFSLAATWVRW
jgi:hypothetical protein